MKEGQINGEIYHAHGFNIVKKKILPQNNLQLIIPVGFLIKMDKVIFDIYLEMQRT